MDAVFESYNDAGALQVSTRYPLLANYKVETVTAVSDGINSEALSYFPEVQPVDAPIAFLRPRTLGVFTDSPGLLRGDGNPISNDTRPARAIRVRCLTWDWKPVVGAWDVSTYYQKMIDSFSGFGLQTFDENGTLLYDSQTPAMAVVKIARDGDWTFERQIKRPRYTVWVYSTAFPLEAEGYRRVKSHTYSGDPLGGGNAYFGAENALDRLTCQITTEDEFPSAITAPPWVMFVRRNIKP